MTWDEHVLEMRAVLLAEFDAICRAGHGEVHVSVKRRDEAAGDRANPGVVTVESRPMFRRRGEYEAYRENATVW